VTLSTGATECQAHTAGGTSTVHLRLTLPHMVRSRHRRGRANFDFRPGASVRRLGVLYSFCISERGQWSGGDAECAKAGPLRSGPPIALLPSATWLASVNAAYVGEYADRNSAMLRVENSLVLSLRLLRITASRIGPRDDVEQFFLIGRQMGPYLPQFVDRDDSRPPALHHRKRRSHPCG
jgi:hypothetical protein